MTFQNETEARFWRTVFNRYFGALVFEDVVIRADEAVRLYRERAADLEKVKNMEALDRNLAGGEACEPEE